MKNILEKFNLKAPYYAASTGQNSWIGTGEEFNITSPVDGLEIGKIKSITASDFEKTVDIAQKAFYTWRTIPAPQRGEIVRQFGDALRATKDDLCRHGTLSERSGVSLHRHRSSS